MTHSHSQAMAPASLLSLEHSLLGPALAVVNYPWEILPQLSKLILALGPTLDESVYYQKNPGIWVAYTAELAPSCSLTGPAIIGPESILRPGAYVRGNVIVGSHCVVGNSTELKNCVLFDRVQVPHYNYIGDAILGYRAHMGAGAITSNVKADRSLVTVLYPGEAPLRVATGLKKFGAILGDGVEVGCNAVLNPGTVIGRESIVYPLAVTRGYIPSKHIYKPAAQPFQAVPMSRGDD